MACISRGALEGKEGGRKGGRERERERREGGRGGREGGRERREGGRGGREGEEGGRTDRRREGDSNTHCIAGLSRLSTCVAHPVNDCSPAPMVERSAPIRMTHFEGQARRETVRPLA